MDRQKIWDLMAENGMKKVDLVRATGLGRSTIDRILDIEDYDPNISTLAEIARVFGVKVAELLAD